RACEIALAAGSSLPRALELVATFRRRHQLPIILYGYYNPIFHYGPEQFARDARAAGVDAVLVVDLPPEEVAELRAWIAPAGLHFIFLLAPTSDPSRIEKVLTHASGFLYYVSLTGVTGVQAVQPQMVRPAIEDLRKRTDLPIGVGFGISTPEQAQAVAEFADAAVVGSAIMRMVHQHAGKPQLVSKVADLVASLKAGVVAARRAA
ncbi:MAG TPA: tryptophan synthase subunit alpha, partial [Terriglobales bacterium]|nr:tryptophan synthase subunit alpha [Terriglobales bacterium]